MARNSVKCIDELLLLRQGLEEKIFRVLCKILIILLAFCVKTMTCLYIYAFYNIAFLYFSSLYMHI